MSSATSSLYSSSCEGHRCRCPGRAGLADDFAELRYLELTLSACGGAEARLLSGYRLLLILPFVWLPPTPARGSLPLAFAALQTVRRQNSPDRDSVQTVRCTRPPGNDRQGLRPSAPRCGFGARSRVPSSSWPLSIVYIRPRQTFPFARA